MNFNLTIGKFSLRLGAAEVKARPLGRSYVAAQFNRLNADWLMPQTNADAEIAGAINALRGRARELERNNEYIQRYLTLLDNNVLGSGGVGLQMKIADLNGMRDGMANDIVRDGWRKWGRRENCSVSGQYCWREVEGHVLRRAACDGGVLVRLVRGWDNPFGFAVQPLEMDHLDTDYHAKLGNGNEIRFGIEFDEWHRPLAFHLFAAHPGDLWGPRRQRVRVAADELLHIFWSERPNQSLGVPWFACVMQALEHLGKYREAELVASRISACQGYAIEPPVPQGWNGDEDEDGKQLQEMQPGMGMLLNPGEKLHNISPTHPNSAFPEFVKGALRGISGGLGVNYNSLANDLESVNYSSMRAGKLEEVEEYKNVQAWLVECLHTPIFNAWLESSLISGALRSGTGAALPVSKYDKFNAPDWKPRRWPWVDPLKDAQASVLAIEKGLKSRRQIIAESGDDIEAVFEEMAEDEKLADKHGLKFPTLADTQAGQANAAKAKEMDDDEEEEEEDVDLTE